MKILCLIVFAYKVHPGYKLIIAANRDEFYKRPTAPAHFWEDAPNVLAGRDLEKMGTWMGVTMDGRFAALTNYRDPKEITEGKRSRGELVAEFLKSSKSPSEYLEEISREPTIYPGYNLLVGDNEDLFYYSNIAGLPQKLAPGIYGVSNHLLNTNWPKVEKGVEGMSNIIHSLADDITEKLFTLLRNADPAPDEKLPKTGVTLEWERLLSPVFIKSKGYGTRSSTVILMSEKQIEFHEKVHGEEQVNE